MSAASLCTMSTHPEKDKSSPVIAVKSCQVWPKSLAFPLYLGSMSRNDSLPLGTSRKMSYLQVNIFSRIIKPWFSSMYMRKMNQVWRRRHACITCNYYGNVSSELTHDYKHILHKYYSNEQVIVTQFLLQRSWDIVAIYYCPVWFVFCGIVEIRLQLLS